MGRGRSFAKLELSIKAISKMAKDLEREPFNLPMDISMRADELITNQWEKESSHITENWL